MADAQDDVLVERARAGDADAFGLLYHRYKLDVWNLAYFTLRDHHDAEESLQETFLKAYRALGQYRRNDSMRAWLLTICRNTCMDRLRSGRRVLLSLDTEEVSAVASHAVDRDRHIDFRQALAELPAEDREAFFLVDVMGCRSDEAAHVVGVRASSTIRSRVARARRHLAPAVSDAPAPQIADGGAEIWGLYHASGESVIIVAVPANRAADGNARRGLQELLARLHACAPGSPTAPAGDGGLDLVAFFDGVDQQIPETRRVVALVDDFATRQGPAIGRWLNGHPRWQLLRAPSHAAWLGQVEGLLEFPAREEHARIRAILEASTPFLWTKDA